MIDLNDTRMNFGLMKLVLQQQREREIPTFSVIRFEEHRYQMPLEIAQTDIWGTYIDSKVNAYRIT